MKTSINRKVAKKKVIQGQIPKHPLKLNLRSWNREKAMEFICDQIATSSRGLGNILSKGYEGNNLPAYSNVMVWLSESEKFQEMYARAKADQADYLADEILDIADNATNDYMERLDADGKSKSVLFDKEHVQRSRLRIETRKWLMGKLKPKKYGEKIDINHGRQPDNPLTILARAVQGAALPIKE